MNKELNFFDDIEILDFDTVDKILSCNVVFDNLGEFKGFINYLSKKKNNTILILQYIIKFKDFYKDKLKFLLYAYNHAFPYLSYQEIYNILKFDKEYSNNCSIEDWWGRVVVDGGRFYTNVNWRIYNGW